MFMKLRSRKFISLFLVLCMVLPWMPGQVSNAAEESAITITKQPVETVTVNYNKAANAHYADLSVEAVSVSGSAISFQWYMNDDLHPVEGATSKDISIPKDLNDSDRDLIPGTYVFYCVISDGEGHMTTSKSTKLTINKAKYDGATEETIDINNPDYFPPGTFYVISQPLKEAFYDRPSKRTITITGNLFKEAYESLDVFDNIGMDIVYDWSKFEYGASSTVTIEYKDNIYYEDTTYKYNIIIADAEPVNITGITAADREYDGTPWKGYMGTPVADNYKGDFKYLYTGTDNSGNPYDRSKPPTNAGNYTLTISTPNRSFYTGSIKINFNIIRTSPTPTSDPTPEPTTIPEPTPVPSVELDMDIKGIDGQGKINISNNEENKALDISIELPTESIRTAAEANNSNEPLSLEIPIASEGLIEAIRNSDLPEARITLTIPESVHSQENINISNIKLDQKLLEAARESGKDITLSVADEKGREMYSWTFEADNLAASDNELTDVNLSLTLQAIEDSEVGQLLNENAEEEAKGLVINFGHEGILPSEASVRIYVGDQYGIEPGDRIYLYHYNPETGKLETMPHSSRYTVDKDGYITINLLHCSDYAILPKEAGANQITSLRNQIHVTVDKSKLSTGNSTNSTAKITVKLPATLELVKNIGDKTSNPALGGVSVAFHSSDTKVAVVDENGVITAKGKGEALIHATVTLYSKKTKKVVFKIVVK